MISKIIDQVGDWNPQLFREIKGRIQTRNIIISTLISICGQALIYLFYESALPSIYNIRNSLNNRYCTDYSNTTHYGWYHYPCLQDAVGNLLINWQLWWLDLFICISIIGIFALLVVGSYMLIADLSKEENRGTLGFIRLSPQSVSQILIGKMLGVPILLYWVGLLATPLHLIAGLKAQIPLTLIASFYAVLAVSCLFFYSMALLYALVSSKTLGGFQAWFGSGVVLFYLFCISGITFDRYASLPWQNAFDWLRLFYPGTMLVYLVDATGIAPNIVNYLPLESLANLKLYELALWQTPILGITIILLHFGLWNYWIWQGLKRRFYNQDISLISKKQSYWLSTSFVTILLGFVAQKNNAEDLFYNFGGLLILNLLLFLILIAALSPHRQTLQDWARYRHQTVKSERRKLLNDLIWGEKSPSTVAIAINLVSTTIILVPGILLLPLNEYKIRLIYGIGINISIILLYAAIAQSMLLVKTAKRAVWAASTVTAMIVVPIIIFAIFRLDPDKTPFPWLFSAFPVFAIKDATISSIFWSICGQWLAITLTGLYLNRQLRLAGESATKALLSSRK